MVRPLDHVIVIQQINFAERVHQNLQTHPEISKLQSEVIEQQKRAAERRRTRSVNKTERSRIIKTGERTDRRGGGKKGGSVRNKRRRGIDFKA